MLKAANIVCLATFAVFAVLKWTGYIDWSWWIVTSPIWLLVALYLIVVLSALLIVSAIGIAFLTATEKATERL